MPSEYAIYTWSLLSVFASTSISYRKSSLASQAEELSLLLTMEETLIVVQFPP